MLLALVLRLFEFPDPWSGKGFKSAFGAFATGSHARGFYQHGFADSGWMPFYWRLELADGTVVRDLYTHHPPFYALLSGLCLRLFGLHEWALRLPWTLFSLLAILSLHRLFRLLWGERPALFGALFLAVVPLSSWWGTLAWVDGALIFLYGLQLHAYVRWLRGGGRRCLLEMAALSFLGGLVDWPMHFLLPGLLLHAGAWAWRRGGARALLPLAAVPAAALASIALHRLHMALVVPPGVGEADTQHTLGAVMRMPLPWLDFLQLQGRYALKYLTLPGTVLVVAGLLRHGVRAARGRLGVEGWLPLVMLPPGVMYVLLFPGRSLNHDFFVFISLPAFAALAALELDLLARSLAPAGGRRASPRAALAAVAAVAVPPAVAAFLGRQSLQDLFDVLAVGTAAVLVLLEGRALLRPRGSARLQLAGPPLLFAVLLTCGWRHLTCWAEERSRGLSEFVGSEWLAPLLEDERAVIVGPSSTRLQLHFYSAAPIVGLTGGLGQLLGQREALYSRLEEDRRVVCLFDLELLDPGALLPEVHEDMVALHEYLRREARSELHLELSRFGYAFELFELSEWARR